MNDLSRSRIRGFLGLLLVALAGLWPGLAQASFPATSDPTVCTTAPCYEYAAGGYPWRSSMLPACQDWASTYNSQPVPNASYYYTNIYVTSASGSGGWGGVCSADLHYTSNGQYATTNTSQLYRQSVPAAAPVYSCPANSTLSGGTCTCTPPAVQNAANNGCEVPQPCAWAQGLRMVIEGSVILPRASPMLCMHGCKFTGLSGGSNDGMYWQNDAGVYVGHYAVSGLTGTSSVCDGTEGQSVGPNTPEPTAPTTEPDVPKLPCPPGENQGTATYGGTTVTLCTKAPVITADKQKVIDKQNAGTPQEVTTEKESETICTGDLCKTTTTTTTKDATGATVGVTVNVNDSDKGTVCLKTPENKVCGKGGGTVGGSGYGNPQDGALPGESLPVGNITPDALAGFNIGAACPAAQTFTVFGKAQELSYQPLCDLAPKIKPFVLIASAFGALLLVYGALTPRD